MINVYVQISKFRKIKHQNKGLSKQSFYLGPLVIIWIENYLINCQALIYSTLLNINHIDLEELFNKFSYFYLDFCTGKYLQSIADLMCKYILTVVILQ